MGIKMEITERQIHFFTFYFLFLYFCFCALLLLPLLLLCPNTITKKTESWEICELSLNQSSWSCCLCLWLGLLLWLHFFLYLFFIERRLDVALPLHWLELKGSLYISSGSYGNSLCFFSFDFGFNLINFILIVLVVGLIASACRFCGRLRKLVGAH